MFMKEKMKTRNHRRNTEMKKSISAVSMIAAAVCAISLSAQAAMNWDRLDPLPEAMTLIKVSAKDVPSITGKTLAAAETSLDKIAAKAVGSNTLDASLTQTHLTVDLNLILNNDKDRVGVNALVCDADTTNEEGDIQNCQEFTFVFPGLSYDKGSKQLFSGSEIVGRKSFFKGVSLNKGYKLTYKISSQPADFGFNRGTVKTLEVFLAKSA
jgi:hypothetical protein